MLLEELSLAMKLTVKFYKTSRISRTSLTSKVIFSFDISFLTNDIDLYNSSSVILQEITDYGPEIWHGYRKGILASEQRGVNYLFNYYKKLNNSEDTNRD